MTTEHAPVAPPSRLLFLDWLRIGAFAWLVLYHVGMYYVSWGWHVKSPFASTALEPWMRLSSPWRLSLLFLVSGAATSFMLQRAGASGALLAARSKRLLWPLLFGMAVIVPPQSYFEVVQQHGYGGSYLAFLALYFSGHGGFCKAGGGCLILPTWNHLWFVAYLLVYTLLLWALLRRWPLVLDRAAGVSARLLRGPALLALPIAAFAVLRLMLFDRFAPTHALVDDWYLHACYFAAFALGAAWARSPSMWQRCAQWRWAALLLALVAWGALVAGNGAAAGAAMPRGLLATLRVAYATMQWSAIVAAVGFAYTHLNRDHRWRATLAEAVFPVYIVHQTLIIVFAMALAPLRAAPVAEAPALVAGTFAASFAVYLLVRRVPWLRAMFGLGPVVTRASAPGARLATRETSRGEAA